ncbi:MAG: FKBP-type peptidyl-prolyl cis-trans isomerase [Bdellovibrionales bacterium]|nr:FKBP-type peptidyl-prolyl cis-trans isomerase [Bdellovibrionales bacterium]
MQMSKPSLSSDDDKTIYAIGVDMGTRIKTLQLSDKEMSILKMGIDDGAGSAKPKIDDMRTYISKVGELLRNRQKQFAEKEAKESEAFMAKASSAGAKTESGMVYVEKKAGSGESPKPSDRVKVNYHGTLRDGTVFDSTKDRGKPATFRLDRVIKCWTEGVQKMKVGGTSELYCPAALAYGDRGAPPKIPPGAALKFEVELLEIVKDQPKPTGKPVKKPAKKK